MVDFTGYFPYAQADFQQLRYKNQFFVDKTEHIRRLEKVGPHLLFLRPPRWGKSQFLTMLNYYYDIKMESQFRDLFGDLNIGKNPTSLRNSFHVLKLDFSIENTKNIGQKLHNNINSSLEVFLDYYNLDQYLNPTDSFANLKTIAGKLATKNARLLILVDEYDRFANKLMLENAEKYFESVAGKSGAPSSSPIRSFYETLKSIHTLQDYRSISMGITPITLADASGANYLENISHEDEFGDMVGFTKSDLRRALSEINITDDRSDSLLNVMTRFYNGYRFFGSPEPLYNPTLCLYFLKKLTKPKTLNNILNFAKTKNPKPLGIANFTNVIMDENVQISENVLKLINQFPIDVRGIISKLLNTNKSESVININEFPKSFKIREIVGVLEESNQTHTTKLRERLLSFMFHHGLVTLDESFDESSYDEGIPLRIPNEMVRGPMMENLQQFLRLEVRNIIDTIKNPSVERVKKLIWSIVSKQQTLHDNSFSEGAFQGEIESALRACARYTGSKFIVSVEKVVSKDKRCDLVLIVEEEKEKFTLLVELKRIRPNSLGKQYDAISYELLQNFYLTWSEKSDDELRKSPIVKYVGKYSIPEDYVYEVEDKATVQALNYKKLLQNKKSTFRSHVIRAFTVVQVGWPLLVKEVIGNE